MTSEPHIGVTVYALSCTLVQCLLSSLLEITTEKTIKPVQTANKGIGKFSPNCPVVFKLNNQDIIF